MSDTKVNWISGDLNEEQLAEAIHTESMSRDAAVACAGRLMKETMPGVSRWMKAELARGTKPSVMVSAACDLQISLMGSLAATFAGGTGPKAALIMAMMLDPLSAGFHRATLAAGGKKDA